MSQELFRYRYLIISSKIYVIELLLSFFFIRKNRNYIFVVRARINIYFCPNKSQNPSFAEHFATRSVYDARFDRTWSVRLI